jgi:hypothetical protein
MPHSTAFGSSMRAPSLSRSSNLHSLPEHADDDDDDDRSARMMEKFPDYPDATAGASPNTNGVKANGYLNGGASADRWQARRESSQQRAVRWGQKAHGHERQKSLGDAIRTIRSRHGSVSQNAHEIADALKAPVSPKLIVWRPCRCRVASPTPESSCC